MVSFHCVGNYSMSEKQAERVWLRTPKFKRWSKSWVCNTKKFTRIRWLWDMVTSWSWQIRLVQSSTVKILLNTKTWTKGSRWFPYQRLDHQLFWLFLSFAAEVSRLLDRVHHSNCQGHQREKRKGVFHHSGIRGLERRNRRGKGMDLQVLQGMCSLCRTQYSIEH